MNETTATSLGSLIDKEHGLLRELAALLEHEFAAARSRNSDQQSSKEILEKKAALLEALDEATTARMHWLDSQQLPSQGEALKATMIELDRSGGLSERYLRFEADAIACRDRNRQLGQLNLRQLQSVEQTLRLFAQHSDDEGPAYTPLGESQAPQASRLLGSA